MGPHKGGDISRESHGDGPPREGGQITRIKLMLIYCRCSGSRGDPGGGFDRERFGNRVWGKVRFLIGVERRLEHRRNYDREKWKRRRTESQQ